MSATLIRGQQEDMYFKELKEGLHAISRWYLPVIDSVGNVHIFWDAVEVAVLGKVTAWNEGEIPYGLDLKSNFLNIAEAEKIAVVLLRYAKSVAKLHDQKK